ncbi:predicted protein [Naegleria gruberi]|uniref:Predicted protein n=1 Tax=Naegleria gruberi TaxID=5762 RepID=D2VXA0_NAEGR|nr:uncharacterized protein NAEGRDRAFT_52983 [Naegleria gruberi]EFC38590.1 predicted protein [Naegleria gruberi]|eukprot:XP_002671334.1 predicted protein [Naegleria gruberi strain NEG-M]
MSLEASLLSKKITLSPRVNSDEKDFFSEDYGEEFEKPIIMQEEILLDGNNSNFFDFKPNQEEDQVLIPKYKKNRNAIPGKSIELQGVDNSKLVRGKDTIEKIKRKHNIAKNTSPLRPRVTSQTPDPIPQQNSIVHVPLSEFSATRLEVHLPQSLNQKTKPVKHLINNQEEMISIEVVKDVYASYMSESNYENDDEYVINITKDDSSTVSSGSEVGGDNFEIIKSKVSIQPDYSTVKMETKQIMEEEIKTMKNMKKKVPSIATQQLDFFKRKSRDLFTDNFKDSSFKKKNYSQVKSKVNSMLYTSDEENEDIDIERRDDSQLSIKLPFLDKKKKKRKTKTDLTPEKVPKPELTTTFSVQSFSEFEEVDFFDGNEDMGIVDDVIKAASARGCSNLPKTKIPKKYHIIETTPIATRDELDKNSQYNIEKKLWETTLFPSNKPTSRIEVVQLARTFEQMLSELKEKKKDEASEVNEEITILDVIASEISRQISGQCAERGILLDKLVSRFKRLTSKSTKISKEAASKLEDIQAREKQVNSMVDFYTDLAKSKEDQLAKKEEEIIELLDQIERLKSQLRQTKKGIHAMTSEYFQERIRQEMVSKSLQVTPRENPNYIMEPIKIPTPRIIEEELKESLSHSNIEKKKIQTEERSVNTPTIEGISLDSIKEIERFNSLFVKTQVEEDEVDIFQRHKPKPKPEPKPPQEVLKAKTKEKETQTAPVIMKKPEAEKPVHSPRTVYETKYKQGSIRDKAVQVITAIKPPTPPPPPVVVVQPKPVQILPPQPPPVVVASVSTQTFLAGEVIKPSTERQKSESERNPSPTTIRSVSPVISQMRSSLDKNEVIKKRIDSNVNSQPESRNSKRDSIDFLKYKMKLVKPEDIYSLFKEILSSDKSVRKQTLRWMNKMILDIFLELSASDFLFHNNELVLIRKFVYDFFLLKFGLPTIALNKMLKTYFKKLYIVRDRIAGPNEFITKNEKISKSNLLEVYHQTTTIFHELIEKRVKEEERFRVLQSHNNLWSTLERQNLEDGMNSYRMFVIDALSNMHDETFKVFAIMIQKLVPVVGK